MRPRGDATAQGWYRVTDLHRRGGGSAQLDCRSAAWIKGCRSAASRRRQGDEQVRDRSAEAGVAPIGRDFGQGGEDEAALMGVKDGDEIPVEIPAGDLFFEPLISGQRPSGKPQGAYFCRIAPAAEGTRK